MRGSVIVIRLNKLDATHDLGSKSSPRTTTPAR